MTPGTARAASTSLVQNAACRGVGVACRRQRHLRRQHVIGRESRVDVLQPHEALEQKPRRNEEHERERGFDDDERRTRQAGAPSRRSARAVVLEQRPGIAAQDDYAGTRPKTTPVTGRAPW